jgi:hypothetical protein
MISCSFIKYVFVLFQKSKFSVGEDIEGFWRFDDWTEKWLPGTISKVYTNGMVKLLYE